MEPSGTCRQASNSITYIWYIMDHDSFSWPGFFADHQMAAVVTGMKLRQLPAAVAASTASSHVELDFN